MLHDERILKNKFAYFLTIIFVFSWLIFFTYNIFNIFLRGYGIDDAYTAFKIPIYILYFLIFPLLIIAFISIFKESKKMFICLNISVFLMIIFHTIFFYVKYQKSTNPTVYFSTYVFMNMLFVVGPTLLINYFRHTPAKNEIEEIGKHND